MKTIHDATTARDHDPLEGVEIHDDDFVKVAVSGRYYRDLQKMASVLNRVLPQTDGPDTPQTLLKNFILTIDTNNEFECIVDGLDYAPYLKPTDSKAEIEAQEEAIRNRLTDAWRETKK